MKTFKITIEETISQTFIYKANSMEEAMEIAQSDYEDGFLVLENPTLIAKQMSATDEKTGATTEWVEF